jgi:hypothetical protein
MGWKNSLGNGTTCRLRVGSCPHSICGRAVVGKAKFLAVSSSTLVTILSVLPLGRPDEPEGVSGENMDEDLQRERDEVWEGYKLCAEQ